MAWAPLRTALEAIADVRHGCFALYSFDGATLHIGSSTSSEALATRIEAVLDPSRHLIDRDSVAMIELWPLPQLATSPDADADAIVARVGATEMHLTLYKVGSFSTVQAPVDEVRAELRETDKGVGPLTVNLLRAGPAHFISSGLIIPIQGKWDLTITVRVGEFDEKQGSISFNVR